DGIRDGHVTGVQTCALPIYCKCDVPGDHPLAERKNIGVIMLPRKPRDFFIPAKRTPDAAHLIRRHGFPIPRAPEDDSTFTLPVQIGRASCRERVTSSAGSV